MKLQSILGGVVIIFAVSVGVIAIVTGEVSVASFCIWLGIVIVSRAHIIYIEG